jgi:hypothetical protein
MSLTTNGNHNRDEGKYIKMWTRTTQKKWSKRRRKIGKKKYYIKSIKSCLKRQARETRTTFWKTRWWKIMFSKGGRENKKVYNFFSTNAPPFLSCSVSLYLCASCLSQLLFIFSFIFFNMIQNHPYKLDKNLFYAREW